MITKKEANKWFLMGVGARIVKKPHETFEGIFKRYWKEADK